MDEDQQVERIKDFWNEHGKGIIAGLVIGFALFYGWRYYDAETVRKQEAQSEQFEQLIGQLESGDEQATAAAQEFLQANVSSTYAHLTGLEIARTAIEQGDLATAASVLQTVSDNASGSMKAVAEVRLARVLLAQEQYDAALTALTETGSTEGFTSIVAELRGDILLAMGDTTGARSAYQEALAATDNSSPLAEIKLNSIPAES